MRYIIPLFVVCISVVASANAQAQTKMKMSDDMGKGAKSDTKMSDSMQKDMKKMNQMMVDQLGDGDKNYDARFIDMMISHHEGAVMMAQDALKKSERKEIRDMATQIIKDQKKQIDELKSWRKEWYGDTAKAK